MVNTFKIGSALFLCAVIFCACKGWMEAARFAGTDFIICIAAWAILEFVQGMKKAGEQKREESK